MTEPTETTPAVEARQDPRHAVIASVLRGPTPAGFEANRVWGRMAIDGGPEVNAWAGTPEDVADNIVNALNAMTPEVEVDEREYLIEVLTFDSVDIGMARALAWRALAAGFHHTPSPTVRLESDCADVAKAAAVKALRDYADEMEADIARNPQAWSKASSERREFRIRALRARADRIEQGAQPEDPS
ncbi:hypothetical protein [Demequina sp.]|uniref:hypothetical protein n=1 Tax=Demequina sp. TaxID=2050685 RepID=UPI0025C68355|nr:hypothetical protein [Demequina sp.]